MTPNQLIKSGFFKSFIVSYLEEENYLLTERNKLLYILADSDEQKQKLTLIEIEKLKDKIKSFNCNECQAMSYSYIISTIPTHHEFIKEEDRLNFWIEKFTEAYIEIVYQINVVTREYKKIKRNTKGLNESDDDFESKFWNLLRYYKPENTDINLIISNELKLIESIKQTIRWNKGYSGSWIIDFDEYRDYIKTNVPIKKLFEYCELLFALHTLEMFKSFIDKPFIEQREEQPFKRNLWFRVGIALATGEIDKLIHENGRNYTQISKILGNINYRPYISESISDLNKSDKNIFKSGSKLLKVYQHCTENKIEMTDKFKKKIESIKNSTQ